MHHVVDLAGVFGVLEEAAAVLFDQGLVPLIIRAVLPVLAVVAERLSIISAAVEVDDGLTPAAPREVVDARRDLLVVEAAQLAAVVESAPGCCRRHGVRVPRDARVDRAVAGPALREVDGPFLAVPQAHGVVGDGRLELRRVVVAERGAAEARGRVPDRGGLRSAAALFAVDAPVVARRPSLRRRFLRRARRLRARARLRARGRLARAPLADVGERRARRLLLAWEVHGWPAMVKQERVDRPRGVLLRLVAPGGGRRAVETHARRPRVARLLGGVHVLEPTSAGASSRAPAAGRGAAPATAASAARGRRRRSASASDRWIASLNCASSSEAPRRVSRPSPRGGADASLVMRTSGSGQRMTSLVPSSSKLDRGARLVQRVPDGARIVLAVGEAHGDARAGRRRGRGRRGRHRRGAPTRGRCRRRRRSRGACGFRPVVLMSCVRVPVITSQWPFTPCQVRPVPRRSATASH